jgi:HAD superfamily hydrolase (TIGR01509 family)
MTQLQAIIFDVDGTIAETERDGHRVAFNRAFQAAGLEWHWSVELYGELLQIPGGKERIRHYWQRYQSDYHPPEPVENWIAQLHRQKSDFYRDCITQGLIGLRPGVLRLLTAARTAGIRLAIATTSALPNAMALLEKNLDSSWFDVIAAGDIVPNKKPAPDVYFYVLEKLKLAPENCLVIEDSAAGLQAAIAAGLTTIVTVNDYTKAQDFTGARLVLSHLGEPEKPLQIYQGHCSPMDCFTLEMARSLLTS